MVLSPDPEPTLSLQGSWNISASPRKAGRPAPALPEPVGAASVFTTPARKQQVQVSPQVAVNKRSQCLQKPPWLPEPVLNQVHVLACIC